MNAELWEEVPGLAGIEMDAITGRIRYQPGSPPIICLRRPLVWVRHGLTDNNINQKLNGCLASPPGSLLNQRGREQARAMARLLYDDLVQATGAKMREYLGKRSLNVWLSPLSRARDTAHQFKIYLDFRIRADFPGQEFPPLSWEIRDELKEHSYGILDGLNPDNDNDLQRFPAEARQRYRQLSTQWRKLESAAVHWPGGETFLEGTRRLKPFLEELSRDPMDGVDVVFAHGISGNSARVLIRDATLLSASGRFLSIRNNSPAYGEPFWLRKHHI